MNYTDNHIDDLIGKYLSGEASAEDILIVEAWVATSEMNGRYFEQVKTIFTRSTTLAEKQTFDAEAAWVKMKQKISGSNESVILLKSPANNFNFFLKIAASILVFLGIGYGAYVTFKPSASDSILVIAENQATADTLPDGTGVFLNKTTQLAYSFDKKKKQHIVKLQGEAYFQINHTEEKRFVVEVGSVFIRDIGTSFNVKAYPGSNTIEVVVEEGEVMFYTDADSGISLRANGKGIYDKVTKKFSIENPEANETSYKSKYFIFSDTELETVVRNLNAVYETQIIIGKNLLKCRLTVNFNNESPEEIVNVITETLGLTKVKTDKGFLIEGPSCMQ